VSLRILFADDSVTAQNMGKKILTEAGYEVVAVSNGAAAVKKIAEQKPDIIILDVYMPGYSGLEVCEKVRSSIATIKTPVLLTVGKMEPYKPEDANRVRADGVIIKPFEASDLLAIVKKFEERIGETAAAVPPPPPPPVREEMSAQPAETNHEPAPRVVQPMVEVPDHMASASAFSDLLSTDATRLENFYVPPVQEVPAPVVGEDGGTAAAHDYDVPASWRPEPEPQPTLVESPVASAGPGVAAAPARPLQIPVYQEPEPSQFEVVPTASAPVGDIEIPREAGLQENAHETTRNTLADHRDPDLVPTAHYIAQPQTASLEPATAPGIEAPVTSWENSSTNSESAPGITAAAVEPAEAAVAPSRPDAPSLSEADFEARVAAAMAAYGQPAEVTQAAPVFHTPSAVQSPSAADETQPLPVMDDAALEAAARAQQAPIVEEAPEFHQPVTEAAVLQQVEEPSVASADAAVPSFSHQPEAVHEPMAQAATGVNAEEITSRVEEELPSAAQAVAQQAAGEAEHDTIAQAVHRVMERMKHNLVEEIVRELNKK
jgi:CheY-like chemotaxis protein